nr:hypothetical protein CFP56_57701 [Quercus suber]
MDMTARRSDAPWGFRFEAMDGAASPENAIANLTTGGLEVVCGTKAGFICFRQSLFWMTRIGDGRLRLAVQRMARLPGKIGTFHGPQMMPRSHDRNPNTMAEPVEKKWRSGTAFLVVGGSRPTSCRRITHAACRLRFTSGRAAVVQNLKCCRVLYPVGRVAVGA